MKHVFSTGFQVFTQDYQNFMRNEGKKQKIQISNKNCHISKIDKIIKV